MGGLNKIAAYFLDEDDDFFEETKMKELNNNESNRNRTVLTEAKTKTANLDTNDKKSSVRLKLGSYKATKIPISILLFGYTCGGLAVSSLNPDPRVNSWFLMDNPAKCLFICIIYILFCIVWGPNLMKYREPIRLRRTMALYNAFQVLFSLYIFYEVGMSGWFFEYSYRCQACDYSDNPTALRMTRAGWLFFISKIIDFVDTLFFVLNKKWEHITLLHIVHHSCMCISMCYGISFIPGGHITFMGFLNSGVHVIMYMYYFLSTFGPKMRPYLWWKKYLTWIQLIQFIAIFIHAAQVFFIDCPQLPIGLAIWTCIYASIFFALFIDFYSKEYLNFNLSKIFSKAKCEKLMKNCTSFSSKLEDEKSIENVSFSLKFKLNLWLCETILPFKKLIHKIIYFK